MKLQAAALSAVIFGSLYTLMRKYQSVATLEDSEKQFNQPLFQAFIIFVGMTTIYFFRPFLPEETSDCTKKAETKWVYFLPSLLDVLGTILDTAGLFYTSVSVSQMLKGSALFFTYIFTLAFTKKRLRLNQHLWMISIVLSLGLIGYSNIGSTHEKFMSNPVLGNSLIVLSQLIFALMFIAEERITTSYNIRVSNAVLWEGIWGALISALLLLGFSQMGSDVIKCDVVGSCQLIYRNSNLLIAILLTALAIAPFNYFGLLITKETSALQRCMICTSRMVAVWIVSLFLGWQQFSIYEFVGYLILTYGIYRFSHQPPQLDAEHRVTAEQGSNDDNQPLVKGSAGFPESSSHLDHQASVQSH